MRLKDDTDTFHLDLKRTRDHCLLFANIETAHGQVWMKPTFRREGERKGGREDRRAGERERKGGGEEWRERGREERKEGGGE